MHFWRDVYVLDLLQPRGAGLSFRSVDCARSGALTLKAHSQELHVCEPLSSPLFWPSARVFWTSLRVGC